MTEKVKLYDVIQLHYKIGNLSTFTAIKYYRPEAPPELAGKYCCPTCQHTVAKDDLIFTWRGPQCPKCHVKSQVEA